MRIIRKSRMRDVLSGRRLPEPPRTGIDRIGLAAVRWAGIIHARAPEFAANAGLLAHRWDEHPELRRVADLAATAAYERDQITEQERDTWLVILRSWHDQTPGARMAAIVAFTELHGHRFPDPYAVLTMQLAP